MKLSSKLAIAFFEVDIENTSARPIIARVEGEHFEVWLKT